jgi:hypothetical protein
MVASAVKARYLRSDGRNLDNRPREACELSKLVGLTVVGLHLAGSAFAGEPVAASWPKSIDTPQGRCTVFQPQPATLEGDRLTARAALAVAPGDSTNVVFGIAQIEARAVQDPDGKQTTLSGLALSQTSFAPANAPAMAGLADALRPEFAKLRWTLATEELRAGLDAVERERTAARDIRTAPPRILYSARPAALVVLDGSPQLRALTNSALLRVVNTPYAMLFDPGARRYWLQGSTEWFSAPDWRGEWTPVAQPPAAVTAAVPVGARTAVSGPGNPPGASPRILVATEPTELVVTRGEPTYTPVAGSDLLYVSNSDQLLFLTLDTKEFYVALSGRWYRSAVLTGPWDAVPADRLPPAFARITPGSPKSEALTYVAGTVEAQDAVLQAKIPQITAVERGPAAIDVKYDGAPQFRPVENIGVQYATNTADAVFRVGGQYYLCRDAVWYTGPGPEGPWSVAVSVPNEIQSLPPGNPHYNTKYVYVYGATPEEVHVGYQPGYSGCYVAGPTVVYGTGWWYPGYYGPSYCWSYPATFGFGFGYSSWAGWSVGIGFGYGWLGCGYGWGWGGCYPWGWWGPSGAYWACAPHYPHYGYHHGAAYYHGGNYHGGGYHGSDYKGGGAVWGRPGSDGQSPPPPRSGTRTEVRGDAPRPTDQPGNPQRRTLPEYARAAKSPSPPSTALRSSPRFDAPAKPTGAPGQPTPTPNPASLAPSRLAQTPARPGSPVANPAVPSRPAPPAANAWSGAPATPKANRTMPAPTPAPRVMNSPAPPVYARTPVAGPAPSRPWSGAMSAHSSPVSGVAPRTPSPGSAPAFGSAPTRAAMPSFGSMGSAPSFRAPMAAPAAPRMSAPMRPTGGVSGYSGGAMGRGAPTRGH